MFWVHEKEIHPGPAFGCENQKRKGKTKMKSKKAVRSALGMSVLSIALCAAMLIGTTFAWFTDTATTSVNKITAGNLHVEIQDKNNAKITNLEWVKEDGTVIANQEGILWEPGCTYLLTPFKIVNTGNLALKYKIVITGLDGSAKLLKAIKFTYKTEDGNVFDMAAEGHLTAKGTVGAETKLITVSAHMDEAAGNEYQNEELDGVEFKVYATQDTVENDSYGPNYDKPAEYPIDTWNGETATADALAAATDDTNKVVTVESGKLLAALEEAVNGGNSYADYTIKLTKNLDLNGTEWTPIGTKGTSNVFKGTFDGNGATISNLKISGGSYVALFGETSGATIKDLTVTGEVSGEDVAGIVAKATDTTITNCVSKVNVTATDGKAAGISASFGGTITKCENRGTVATAAAQPAGGLVAWCNAAVIENCHNYGAVTAGAQGALDSAQAGGLCGNLAAGSAIKNCSNSAVITSANFAGGVAGRAGTENKDAIVVEKFTNAGAIKGTYAAGIIADAKNVNIKESSVSGTITGSEIAGGLFGRLRTGEITTSVVDAAVTKNGENGYQGQYVGVIGGTVSMSLTGNERTDDIGCYADVTLTINGRIPNNNDFADLNPQNFVHENQGHTKTIIIVAADGTSTTYTYSIANGYKWAKG